MFNIYDTETFPHVICFPDLGPMQYTNPNTKTSGISRQGVFKVYSTYLLANQYVFRLLLQSIHKIVSFKDVNKLTISSINLNDNFCLQI